MKILFTLLTIFVFLLLFQSSKSQTDTTNRFTGRMKVVAGKEYDRSGLTEVFLGKHWRRLWTTPFEADIIDLNKFAGGLTPYKRGGGLQTKSLRFKGADGKTYKFRSINKDPRRILPPDLQETIFADAFKDQISTSNPLSAIIVAPLLNEVGILNAEPIVVVMPNDNKLGQFQKDFGNVLGTFEESPDDGSDGEKGFAESDKIINSFKLYKKLEKDNDQQVDKTEFLKARLMDLMIGDWDRHSDQWLWAGYKKDGETVYKPIPRDRDQAFSLYDGLIPMIVGESITQLEGYGKNYPKIYDLSFNGRYVDRRFLPGVEKRVYDSLTTYIQSKITNDVIVNAVKKMPAEWYKLEGKELVSMIKSRRDKLREASDEYYELINETADVYGSDKDEQIEIDLIGNKNIEVSVYDLDKNGNKKAKPFFKRKFYNDATNEIRIYTNGGDDKIIVGGKYDSPIDVKILKGKGKKSINDRSDFLEIIKDQRPANDEIERFEPVVEDRGYDWRFGPGFGFNSDDGIVIGGGPILYKHGLYAKPHVYRMSLIGKYAFGAKSYDIQYTGEFYTIVKGANLSLNAGKTELDITRFYGQGNETVLDKDLDAEDFYKVGQELISISPSIEFPLNKKYSFTIAPFYKYSDVSFDENTFLFQDTSIYGKGAMSYAGLNTVASFDTRDHESEPYKGFYVRLFGNYTPELFKDNFTYGKAGFDLRAYVSSDTVKGVTLALRTAGGKVWGKYPFYESMFLGGINSLKGFSRERFAGDGVLLGQAELRMRLFKVNILVPGMLGISAFAGTGRVYLEGEDSKRWHASYGGSLWITYLNRMFNVGLTVAKSDEGFKYFFGTALFL